MKNLFQIPTLERTSFFTVAIPLTSYGVKIVMVQYFDRYSTVFQSFQSSYVVNTLNVAHAQRRQCSDINLYIKRLVYCQYGL